jgi:hypothetical protein
MKPYERPTLTKLTPAQAQLKLVRAVSSGNKAAKDFLDKQFPPHGNKSAPASDVA